MSRCGTCSRTGPGFFTDTDRALAEHGRAAFVVTKLGVPLLWIFPYAEGERVTPP